MVVKITFIRAPMWTLKYILYSKYVHRFLKLLYESSCFVLPFVYDQNVIPSLPILYVLQIVSVLVQMGNKKLRYIILIYISIPLGQD